MDPHGQGRANPTPVACFPRRSLGLIRGPKDHINIRILQTMISGIPLVLGLGTRMSDPYVYLVLWGPINLSLGKTRGREATSI